MITLLGIVIFATMIAIGTLDRNSGLGLFQMYDSPWRFTDPPRDEAEPTRPRRSRDS